MRRICRSSAWILNKGVPYRLPPAHVRISLTQSRDSPVGMGFGTGTEINVNMLMETAVVENNGDGRGDAGGHGFRNGDGHGDMRALLSTGCKLWSVLLVLWNMLPTRRLAFHAQDPSNLARRKGGDAAGLRVLTTSWPCIALICWRNCTSIQPLNLLPLKT